MPYHYFSFMQALSKKYPGNVPLPERPLIVDLGCGPATTISALGNWLQERRGRPLEMSYLGVDNSAACESQLNSWKMKPYLHV